MEQDKPSPNPSYVITVKVLVPMYEPLEVTKCKRCEKAITEPEELIDSWKIQMSYHD